MKKKSSLTRGRPAECMLEFLAFLSFKTGQYVEERFAELFATEQIHARDFCILHVLHHEGPRTQQELCDKLWIDRATMTQALGRLRKHQLVTRKTNPADARSFVIAMTEKGAAMQKRLAPKFRALDARMFTALSATERARVRHALGEVLRRLADPREF